VQAAMCMRADLGRRQSATARIVRPTLMLTLLVVALVLTAPTSAPADAAREWVGLGSINEVTPDPNWSDELNFTNVSSGL
jgi:hypothetical protein